MREGKLSKMREGGEGLRNDPYNIIGTDKWVDVM